jgi:Eukaryotic aspartyl protease
VYQYPCNHPVQVAFQLGGQNYFLDSNDFIIGQLGDQCIGALVEDNIPDDNNEEFVFILGALFMKNVVSVFDLGVPRVGFGWLQGVNSEFGAFTIVPTTQWTGLGTGPYATLSATFQPEIGGTFQSLQLICRSRDNIFPRESSYDCAGDRAD